MVDITKVDVQISLEMRALASEKRTITMNYYLK